MILGAHRATAGGRQKAFASGEEIGCQAIQIFTSSPRQWKAQPVTDEDREAWLSAWQASPIAHVVAHDSYLINLASPDDELRQKSVDAYTAELERCHRLRIPWLVTHPGAHVGAGEATGLERFAATLRGIYDAHPDWSVTTLLESTAGQGTCLGHRLEHLATLLAAIDLPERLAVCLDTCHLFAAGYDLREAESYATTIGAVDSILGRETVKVVHLNDSKGALGSRVDRHEQIGEGEIGDQGFAAWVADDRWAAIPMLVETPDLDRHGANLARLRQLRKTGVKGGQR